MMSKRVLTAALAVAAITHTGCARLCSNDLDCGDEGYCSNSGRCEVECFTDEDCRSPPTCESSSQVCLPLGLLCDSRNKCHGQVGSKGTDHRKPAKPLDQTDGFNDPPGSGFTFIVNRLAIAPRGVGL